MTWVWIISAMAWTIIIIHIYFLDFKSSAMEYLSSKWLPKSGGVLYDYTMFGSQALAGWLDLTGSCLRLVVVNLVPTMDPFWTWILMVSPLPDLTVGPLDLCGYLTFVKFYLRSPWYIPRSQLRNTTLNFSVVTTNIID